jgi:hypothetical protein
MPQQVVHWQNQIWGILSVKIIDDETSGPVSARCYLTDRAGRNWAPPGLITYVKPPEVHFIAPGQFEISLPPGIYVLRVMRGTEYRRRTKEIEIHAGDIHCERFNLQRWINMKGRGWYSGDLHNHRDWREMPRILLSEDLNIAPTLMYWVRDDRIITIPPPSSDAAQPFRLVDAAHAYSILDSEIERNDKGPGAIDLVGLRTPLQFRGGYELYPPNTVFTEATHHQGGYVDAEKVLWRDSAALVALGQIDFVGLVYNHFSPYGVELDPSNIPGDRLQFNTAARMPYWAMDVYYKLLNCGFHLPVSAGTASGVKPIPLGYCRVYVHLREGFTYASWFRGLKAGRSFATNGPMLFLTVDGREPSDLIQIPADAKASRMLKVYAEAVSQDELERLDVVWKGKVIKSIVAPRGEHRLVAELQVPANETGWFVARAFERPSESIRFAHTSPVYVQVGRSLGIVPEDARYFVTMMDHEIEFYRNVSGFRSQADRGAMVDMFQKARRIYERLAAPPSFLQSSATSIEPSSSRFDDTGPTGNSLTDSPSGLEGLVRMLRLKRGAERFGFPW